MAASLTGCSSEASRRSGRKMPWNAHLHEGGGNEKSTSSWTPVVCGPRMGSFFAGIAAWQTASCSFGDCLPDRHRQLWMAQRMWRTPGAAPVLDRSSDTVSTTVDVKQMRWSTGLRCNGDGSTASRWSLRLGTPTERRCPPDACVGTRLSPAGAGFSIDWLARANHRFGTWLVGSRKEHDERVWAAPTCDVV